MRKKSIGLRLRALWYTFSGVCHDCFASSSARVCFSRLTSSGFFENVCICVCVFFFLSRTSFVHSVCSVSEVHFSPPGSQQYLAYSVHTIDIRRYSSLFVGCYLLHCVAGSSIFCILFICFSSPDKVCLSFVWFSSLLVSACSLFVTVIVTIWHLRQFIVKSPALSFVPLAPPNRLSPSVFHFDRMQKWMASSYF